MRKPRRYVSPTTGAVSWRVRYRSASGTEKSETFYDEGLAEEFAGVMAAVGPARALEWLDQQTHDGEAQKVLTVDDLWQTWRAWKGRTNKRGELIEVRSARTLMDYDRLYAKRIKPAFGNRPANLLTQAEVQEWIDGLSSELEPKTIADHHALLHAVYAWAASPSRGMVINDPCAETRLPKRRKKPAKGYRLDEWLILHRAAREVDPDAADLLLFMASTGWRWSECAAVQAMSVDHWTDDEGSHTFVTMGRVLRREGNTYAFVDDAKSDAGQRRIRIVGEGEAMVLRRIIGKRPDDLLLTTKRGGQWRYEHFYRRVWKRPEKGDDAPGQPRILERARKLGLTRDLPPHSLRHTHVYMLMLAGEPLPAIQKRLGHASIKTTNDVYGRMMEDASVGGLEKVAALLAGKVPAALSSPEQDS